jgi:hypothetical protein
MVTISGIDPSLFNPAEQIVFPHYSEHSLVVNYPPFSLQFFGYSSISISGEFQANFQGRRFYLQVNNFKESLL